MPMSSSCSAGASRPRRRVTLSARACTPSSPEHASAICIPPLFRSNARAGRHVGRLWTFAHLAAQVGRIHREEPGTKGIWRIGPRSPLGLFEPFSRFLRIFPGPLHTREVAGSKPAAPMAGSLVSKPNHWQRKQGSKSASRPKWGHGPIHGPELDSRSHPTIRFASSSPRRQAPNLTCFVAPRGYRR
jgi:hypothetical protein